MSVSPGKTFKNRHGPLNCPDEQVPGKSDPVYYLYSFPTYFMSRPQSESLSV